MPMPSGGSPLGDRGAGRGPSAADDLRREQEARESLIKSMVKEARELKELIKFAEDERDAVKAGTDQYKKLQEAVDVLNQSYDKTFDRVKKTIDLYRQESSLLRESIARYKDASSAINSFTVGTKSLIQGFHAYNLEVQRTIDLSGRFVGNSARGRQEFERFREQLKLTQQEAMRFGQTWAQAMRMGASTDQITSAVKKLKDAFGHAGGQAAAGLINQIPMSRTTTQGVLSGQSGAMERALRNATLEQAHALGGLRRGPGDRLSEEAVRFQNLDASVAKLRDDLQAASAAAAAAGLGPEIGALAVPLSEINVKVGKLLEWAVGSRAWLGPALASAAGARLGGGGVVAGAVRGFLGSGLGRLSLAGLGAAGAGYAADAVAGGMAAGPGQRAVRTVGAGARIAGYGLTGAALGSVIPGVGTGIGAGLGVGVGAFAEYGDQISGAITSGFQAIASRTGGGPGLFNPRMAGKESVIGGLDTEYVALRDALKHQMDGLIQDLGNLPTNVQSQLSRSRMPTALENVDPSQMFRIGQDAAEAFRDSLAISSKNWTQQSRGITTAMSHVEASFRRGEITETQKNERLGSFNSERDRLSQHMDQVLGAPGVREAASGAMQRIETRGGQIGQETEAVRTRYQRTGAISGNIEETNRIQQQINSSYEENRRLTEQQGQQATGLLQDRMSVLQDQMKEVGISEDLRRSYQNEFDLTRNQLLQTQRQLNIRKEVLQLENQSQNFELMRERALSAERGILFRRGQQNQALLRAQESFLRESGSRPEEVGGVVRQQSTEAGANLTRFMTTFSRRMQELQGQLQAAPTEEKRIQVEEVIFNLSNRRVELETQALEARKRAAGAEEQYRQEQIGANRRIAEINRDMSARLGQSWRVQMGYQSQIIRLQQQDLQSSRRELEGMAQALGGEARAMQDPGYLNKLADLAQKQAGLAEAIIGKQRNFLEQATAQGFGVGSGSRVSPIINPRMFGEMIQGTTGMRQPGAPLTISQNRAMLLQGVGPQVFGGIPGGMMAPPGGAGGAPLGVPGEVPGVGRPAAVPAVPGGPGPQAQRPIDVSGQIVVKVESNNPNIKAEVERVAIQMSRPGAIV